MALVTGEQNYKNDALTMWNANAFDSYVQNFFDWDNKHQGIKVNQLAIISTANKKMTRKTETMNRRKVNWSRFAHRFLWRESLATPSTKRPLRPAATTGLTRTPERRKGSS